MRTSLGSGPATGEPESPRVGRRPAAAVLAVIALVGVIAATFLLLWRADANDGNGSADPTPTSMATTSGRGSSNSTWSGCPVLPDSDSVPVVPPADTRWELVGRIAAPTAPRLHGPAVVAPVRSCFAHTPTGALYAAVNVLATTTLPDGDRLLTGPLAAAGPGRDEAVRRLATEPDTTAAGVSTQVAGFAFLGYTAEEANIDLAIVSTTPTASGLVHVPLTVRWDASGGSGDWKVVYPESGELFAGVGTVPNLAGYVPWSGT